MSPGAPDILARLNQRRNETEHEYAVPHALPDPNDWVGRGYTDHYIDWVIGVFDEYIGNSSGASSCARADFPGRGALEQVGLPPALQGFSIVLQRQRRARVVRQRARADGQLGRQRRTYHGQRAEGGAGQRRPADATSWS